MHRIEAEDVAMQDNHGGIDQAMPGTVHGTIPDCLRVRKGQQVMEAIVAIEREQANTRGNTQATQRMKAQLV